MLIRSWRRRTSSGGSCWRRLSRSAAACSTSVALLLAPGAGADGGELTLDRLLERMAGASGVELSFRERKELALLSRPLTSRGTLYFVPPDRLARFTREPYPSALVVDGDEVRYRDGLEGETFDLGASPQARVFVENFVVLFTGDREKLERIYDTELVTTDDGSWELRLSPRRSPLDRFLEAVVLRGDDGGLREMEVRDRDGDRTTTRFHDVDRDREFAPAELEQIFRAGRPLPGPTDAP